MKELNLHRIWQIINILSNKQDELTEQGIYVYLLGNRSEYVERSFQNFLEWYSFKVEDNSVIIFNNDLIPWEDYSNKDFNELSFELLNMSDDELYFWAEKETEKQLEEQEKAKQITKKQLLSEIERLNRQLENL
jgi:hypothetical protein